jgi:hypothetical protein
MPDPVVTTPAVTTPAVTTPAVTTPAVTTPAAWHGLTEAADVAYLQNKGWATPGDVINSYRGAEKLIGKDPSTLLTLPRADDPVGFRAAMSRLGMPETADKYTLDTPEGANPAYATWAKETFHKAGLTATQATMLSKANNEYIKSQQLEATKNYERQVTTDKAALLGEWRGGYERMMASAQTAVKALGFSGEMVDALEGSLGYAGTMKFFAALGTKLGEDSFESGTNKPGFNGTMTPQEAKVEWEKMKIDPVQKAALFNNQHPGHQAAKQKQKELFEVMHAE